MITWESNKCRNRIAIPCRLLVLQRSVLNADRSSNTLMCSPSMAQRYPCIVPHDQVRAGMAARGHARALKGTPISSLMSDPRGSDLRKYAATTRTSSSETGS